ncbi:CRISPR-associated endonuclease Cas2 [Pseudofrankia sp. BMG5.37]|uniref:CRISPR-associated endonuclease Cas2 n=1 Tax=Pseudofrankia sp. BMG5.37 TaxID=3050035 RepID=UPI002895F541|nr:CRISPR-associated endonuclease Cas2 [Pseudofrankia sp. BMG5.37]MDT3440467.1 CRISPR-associated endonuclease Cas2 [Pseudofrankia sp. BMG5.37]
MNTPIIVVYDVADDERRELVRRSLRPVADRFQQSGWYLPADRGLTAVRVGAGLAGLLSPADRLGVWQPCPACWRAVRWLPAGVWRPAPALPGPGGWLITETRPA